MKQKALFFIAALFGFISAMAQNLAGGHEYVDLGLPSGTLWATCNVGANKPEEFGDYFAWGETEPKEIYNDSTYSFRLEDAVDDEGYPITEIAGTRYDVAAVKWGKEWCMPTETAINELLTLNSEEVELNGVKGRKFMGKNGNTLFLPYAGFRRKDVLNCAGAFGDYWSATVCEHSRYASELHVYSKCAISYGTIRYIGHSIRPIKKSNSPNHF